MEHDEDYLQLAAALTGMCSSYGCHELTAARALTTALALKLMTAERPSSLIGLVVRDLMVAAVEGEQRRRKPRRRPKAKRAQNVVDFTAARRRVRRDRNALGPEPA